MRVLIRCVIGAITLALVATACTGPDEAVDAGRDAPAEVRIEGFLFHPPQITIRAGRTVTWRNLDRILHTVTAGAPGRRSGPFDGQLPERGVSFSFRFDEAGNYPYFCTRHDHMRGMIVVAE